MRITEVVQNPRAFSVTARVQAKGIKSVVRTTVFADTLAQARAISIQIFGSEHLVSIQTQSHQGCG